MDKRAGMTGKPGLKRGVGDSMCTLHKKRAENTANTNGRPVLSEDGYALHAFLTPPRGSTVSTVRQRGTKRHPDGTVNRHSEKQRQTKRLKVAGEATYLRKK
ncbi:hypothetical protein GN956_G4367 [Arapaima gigas]